MGMERIHPAMSNLISRVVKLYKNKYNIKLTRTEATRIIAEHFSMVELELIAFAN